MAGVRNDPCRLRCLEDPEDAGKPRKRKRVAARPARAGIYARTPVPLRNNASQSIQ
jgi:hypothetical protein